MSSLCNRNTKTIKEINESFSKGELIIDMSYQRRKVWLEQDKVRLIETILLDLVIPEVFFWLASIEADTGEMVTHIVDGQQRIRSIIEFISGDFVLSEKYLLNDAIKERCGNKKFGELFSEDKSKIWSYPLSIVNIPQFFTKKEITQIFYRLNLTNYSLNNQERRKSKESCFGNMAETLSELDFWGKYKVFSYSDIKRMKDVEYCCSIYILANEWIIDQTNNKKINDYYDDYIDSFDEDRALYNKIITGIDIIEKLCDKTTLSFISKKTQLYTLFSFVFNLIDEEIEFSLEIFERFKLFVSAYNLFKNEYNIDLTDSNLSETNIKINKYKLASSEGINKLHNRMIRFKILFDICIEMPSEIKKYIRELTKIYLNEKNSDVSYEALDLEDIDDSEKMS